jgi:hypothetical protein
LPWKGFPCTFFYPFYNSDSFHTCTLACHMQDKGLVSTFLPVHKSGKYI